jgi:hypothetical protein
LVPPRSLPLLAEPPGEAAFGEKILLKFFKLPAEEVAGLVDEADKSVCGGFGGGGFEGIRIGRVRPVGPV